MEVLHSLPSVRQYLFSLYECRYSVFFQSLGEVFVVVVVCVFSRKTSECEETVLTAIIYACVGALPYSENINIKCETLCHSHGGAGDEEGLALCPTLPLLREGDEDSGLQPAARVLPISYFGIHGWGIWCQHRVHWPVSLFVFKHLCIYYVTLQDLENIIECQYIQEGNTEKLNCRSLSVQIYFSWYALIVLFWTRKYKVSTNYTVNRKQSTYHIIYMLEKMYMYIDEV